MQWRLYTFRWGKRKVKFLAMLSVFVIPALLYHTGYLGIGARVARRDLQQMNVFGTPNLQKLTNTTRVESVSPKQQTFVQSSSLKEADSIKNSTNVTTTLLKASTEPHSQPVQSDAVDPQLCAWVNRSSTKPPYFLTAVMHMRIYEGDKAKLTTAEMNQWLLYMSYIGVEHVYVYDGFYTEDEIQRDALDPFIRDNFVTYTDWHEWNPFTYQKTKIPAYQRCIDNYKAEHVWQTALDIDEYPFSPVDTKPGFLARFLESYGKANPSVTQVLMQNFLFLGMPLKEELLIERLWRRTPKVSNNLVKPIYKSADIRVAQIHHNTMKSSGSSRDANSGELRMNHYWGARLQDWGPDTPEILGKTVEDRSMEPMVKAFKDCEPYLRKYMPYTNGNYTYG